METGGETRISTNLTINKDFTVVEDLLDFSSVKSEVETVTDDEDKRETFASLVGTSGRLRSESTTHLVEHPVVRSVNALKVERSHLL